jgi:hypothetical protein
MLLIWQPANEKVAAHGISSQQFLRFIRRFEEFPCVAATKEAMADPKLDKCELTSINQLIQDIIGGTAQRHTFTQWELELLLDLQTCGVRKSARPELLRRYVKAVQQQFAQGSLGPMRLSAFLDKENQKTRQHSAIKLPEATKLDEATTAVLV